VCLFRSHVTATHARALELRPRRYNMFYKPIVRRMQNLFIFYWLASLPSSPFPVRCTVCNVLETLRFPIPFAYGTHTPHTHGDCKMTANKHNIILHDVSCGGCVCLVCLGRLFALARVAALAFVCNCQKHWNVFYGWVTI